MDEFVTPRRRATPHRLRGVPNPYRVLGVPKGQVNKAEHNVVADLLYVQSVEERECQVEEVFNDVVALRVSKHVSRQLVKRNYQIGNVRVAEVPPVLE
jgi:hypothetical protein